MSLKNFIKENFVLAVGLTLPMLLILAFMVFSSLPQTLSDPPKYDMVFSSMEYSNNNSLPVTLNLVVKDGTLKAQYVKVNQPSYNGWRKLYLYEAKTQTVRELPFGFPEDMDQITGTREETVEATKNMRLDTRLQSPDGYELSYDGYSRSGLFNEVFWGGSYSREPRLRKGASSVRLATSDGRTYFYYGNIAFIGWVLP